MLRSKLAERPHWLITKYESSQLEVLTIGSEDEQVLPIFSFEEEAQLFLRFHHTGTLEDAWLGDAWRVRETSVGELTSVLYGPCAGASKVALDPPPEVCGGPLLGLVSVERNELARVLLEGQFSALQPTPSQMWRSVRWIGAQRTAHRWH